jgi:MFS family permease
VKKVMIFNKQETGAIFWISIVLFFRMFSVFLVLPVFNILVQELRPDNFLLIGLAFGIYGLTQGLFQLPFGYLSDKYGRKKMLLLALLFFFIGSLFAAYAKDIYWMIAARFLQGIGAVASIIFALLADHTRDEVRARASAFLGMSIGVAFCLAFVAAPFFAAEFGISELFQVITVMALLSLLIVFFFIPAEKNHFQSIHFWDCVQSCLKHKNLRIIYFGSFLSGVGLSSSLFVTQIFFFNYLAFPKEDLWKIYLPMLVISFCFLFPITFYVESKAKFKNGILLGVGFLLTAFICLLWGVMEVHFWFLAFGLIIFFVGYSIFEPIFPSLVTRFSKKEQKGTASGIYNLLQFFGHFVGAFFSGVLLEVNASLIHWSLIFLSFLFLYFLRNFENPLPKRKS